jgi:hypothetical protein
MKPNYEEMVEKVINDLNLDVSEKGKRNMVLFLNNTNRIVKVLNNWDEGSELVSTQLIAYIINWYLMELSLSGDAKFKE